MALTNEAAGVNCPAGGIKITAGPDTNSSNTLDASEVTQTRYVCNGVDGTNGADGTDGGPNEVRLFRYSQITHSMPPSQAPTSPVIDLAYEDFSVENYLNYDSAVITVSSIGIRDVGGSILFPPINPPGINVIVELVDMSNNNTVIANSTMTLTTGGSYVSKNFFDNLPTGVRDLGISIRMNSDNYFSEVIGISMVIARK